MRWIASTILLAGLLAGPAAAQARDGDGWVGISWRPAGEVMVVADVFPGSPADEAGVEPGDTVLRWNGAPAASAAAEARPAPGDTVRVRIRRGSERDRDLAIVAESRPSRVVMRAGPPKRGEPMRLEQDLTRRIRIHADSLRLHADSLHSRLRIMLRDSLGAHVRELERVGPGRLRDFTFDLDLELGARSVAGAEFAEINPGLAAYFRTEHGALVLRVAPDTPAARAGLVPGDVVVRAGTEEVATVRDLRRALQGRSPGSELPLEVVRRGERVNLRLGS